MTTEQLAALREVASKAAETIPHPSGCRCMKIFGMKFTPATCLELVEEVERLRADHQGVRESVDKLINSNFLCSRCGSQKK